MTLHLIANVQRNKKEVFARPDSERALQKLCRTEQQFLKMGQE